MTTYRNYRTGVLIRLTWCTSCGSGSNNIEEIQPVTAGEVRVIFRHTDRKSLSKRPHTHSYMGTLRPGEHGSVADTRHRGASAARCMVYHGTNSSQHWQDRPELLATNTSIATNGNHLLSESSAVAQGAQALLKCKDSDVPIPLLQERDHEYSPCQCNVSADGMLYCSARLRSENGSHNLQKGCKPSIRSTPR